MTLVTLLAKLLPHHLAVAVAQACALLGHLLGYQTLALLGVVLS